MTRPRGLNVISKRLSGPPKVLITYNSYLELSLVVQLLCSKYDSEGAYPSAIGNSRVSNSFQPRLFGKNGYILNINTTGATCGTVSAYPFGAFEIATVFWWCHVLVFYVVFCTIVYSNDIYIVVMF